MKLRKKAEDYLKDELLACGCTDKHIHIAAFNCAKIAILKAQLDAIDEAVKACAEAAKTLWYKDNNDKLNVKVNKDSILSVADKLKAKL